MIISKSLIYFVLSGIFLSRSKARSESVLDHQLKNTIQFFGEYYVTSCITLLYVEEHFVTKINEIYWMIFQLTSELRHFCVTSMTFNQFLQRYPKWKKIRCNSPLMVITHTDNATKYQMKRVSESRLFHRTFWLLFMNDASYMNEFFEDIKTPFDLRLVVAEVKNETFMEFFEAYRVRDDRPLRTPKLGNWSMNEGYKLETKDVYERRKNLEGIALRTGSTDNYPMHYFVKHPDGKLQLEGYFAEVWRELQRILNFTSIHFPSVDRVTGIPEQSGEWNGLIGMLQRREIEAAVSFFVMDEQRSHVIDFTRPLLRTGYQIFYKSIGSSFHWDAILRPFKKNIWVAVVVWIVVSTLFSWICNKLSHKYGIERSSRRDDFNLINSGLFFTKALCNQGHYCTPSSTASRMIFLTAYIVAGVLVPSYSAALIYFLTSRAPLRPFDSLRELLHAGTYRLQTNSKTAHYTYFSNSTNPLLRQVYLELMSKIPENELPITMAEAIERLCREPNLAHFGDKANAVTYVNKVNSHDGKCEIMHLSKDISSIYSCMGLARDSPFKLLFDYYLHKIVDVGIVDVIERRIIPSQKIEGRPKTWGMIENKDVFQAFVILSTGMILSIFVLVIELLHAKLGSMGVRKTEKIAPVFHLNRKRYLSAWTKQLKEYQ